MAYQAGTVKWFGAWRHRSARAWLVVVAVLVVVVAAVPAVSGSTSPPGRIAFTTYDSDGPSRVNVVDATGANHRRLVEGHTPRWSPDGSRLAFVDRLGISVVAADGSGSSLVVPFGLDPQWSPDGAHLAHVAARPIPFVTAFYAPPFVWATFVYEYDVAVARLADGVLTSDSAGPWADGSPTWSPDGGQVAFVRPGVPLVSHSALHSMPSSGGLPEPQAGSLTASGPVRWSPAGPSLAFYGHDGGLAGVWVVEHGSAAPGVRVHATETGVLSLDWSPDGKMLAFAGGDQYADAGAQVHVVSLDGTTHLHFRGHDVAFSPDGKHVAYCDETGLWRTALDGTAPVLLVATSTCEGVDWGR